MLHLMIIIGPFLNRNKINRPLILFSSETGEFGHEKISSGVYAAGVLHGAEQV